LGLEVPAVVDRRGRSSRRRLGGKEAERLPPSRGARDSWAKPAAIAGPVAIVLVGIFAIGRGGASVSDDRDELHAHFEAFDPLRRAELATLRDEIRVMTSGTPRSRISL